MKATLSYLLTMLIFVAIMCSPINEQRADYNEVTILLFGGVFLAALVVVRLNTSKKEEKEFLDNQQK